MMSGGDLFSQALTLQLGVPAFLFAGVAAIAFGAFLILLGVLLKRRKAVIRLLLASLAVVVIALIGLSFNLGGSADPEIPPVNTAAADTGKETSPGNEAGANSSGSGTDIPRPHEEPRPDAASSSSGKGAEPPRGQPTDSAQQQPQRQPEPERPVTPPETRLSIPQYRQGANFMFDYRSVRFADGGSIRSALRRNNEIRVLSTIGNVRPGTYRVMEVVRGDGGRGILLTIYLERTGS